MGSENATTVRYAPTVAAAAVGAATDGHINTAALGFFVSHREGPGQGKMRES